MKRLAYIITGFALLMAFVPSCKEEEETVLSSDCYISSFTLGNLKRLISYTNATGKDTLYYVSFSGSYYPFEINQNENTIRLREPLPQGTRIDAVTATASFVGALFYRPWEVTTDTAWTAFSSTDSIDFSVPLRFRVYATDGRSHRDYFLHVECRTTDPDAYTWQMENSAFCEADDMRRLSPWNGSLFVLTETEASAQQLDVSSLQQFDGRLWASSADGTELWSRAATDEAFTLHHTFDNASGIASLSLFAGSSRALYGIGSDADGQRGVYRSTDGYAWQPMALDANLSLFPTAPVAISYTQSNGNQRVLVAGPAGDNASECEVWSLLEESGEPWTYFVPASDNPYRLPVLQDLSLLTYNGMLVAMGGASADGQYQSLGSCFVSHDNGITWKADAALVVPTQLQGQPGHVSATSLGNDIWLSAGKELWRARLNSYGETK